MVLSVLVVLTGIAKGKPPNLSMWLLHERREDTQVVLINKRAGSARCRGWQTTVLQAARWPGGGTAFLRNPASRGQDSWQTFSKIIL